LSGQIVAALDAWRDTTEALAERTFLSIYGSPTLQAAVGIDPESNKPLRKAEKNPLHKQLLQTKIAELKAKINAGGVRECLVRAALYIGMPRDSVDERVFELIRRVRLVADEQRLTLAEFKTLVREQFFMLLIDEESALAAIPALLPPEADERRKALTALRQLIRVRGEPAGQVAERMERIAGLFEAERPRIVA
jgi:hypothetical protein